MLSKNRLGVCIRQSSTLDQVPSSMPTQLPQSCRTTAWQHRQMRQRLLDKHAVTLTSQKIFWYSPVSLHPHHSTSISIQCPSQALFASQVSRIYVCRFGCYVPMSPQWSRQLFFSTLHIPLPDPVCNGLNPNPIPYAQPLTQALT